jgi:hypothetical protein
MILTFVNIANHVKDENPNIENDETGETTINFLKQAKKVAQRFNSNHASSLGLHPLLYCYSRSGRYRTVSFLATVYFVIKLVETKHLNGFINIRAEFEQFLFDYNYLVSQIMSKYRSVQKSYRPIAEFWLPVVLQRSAFAPSAELFVPVVLVQSEYPPIAVLFPPVVLQRSVLMPIAVLLAPVVFNRSE